ncbi:MAG: hypothetical protein CMG29_05460 [Candidatus Marinimicrobia bacterium]|nr:hypothetical protein [Candidatus Neomarinimicrobiota bacterium]
MNIKKLTFLGFYFFTLLLGQEMNLTKKQYYDLYIAKPGFNDRTPKILGAQDRKRSVLDKGNVVLRLSNAAIYGYDPWGLCHEFPAGSMIMDGCCTYYWTAGPIVGALKGGVPSVSVGTKYSARDHDEEFEPLPNYDAGYVDTDANIGVAFSDIPESWPDQWPIESAKGDTFMSIIYNASKVPEDTLYFPGIESELGPEGFPDAPCGLGVKADREAYFVVTDNDPEYGNTFASNNGVGPLDIRIDVWVLNYSNTFGNDGFIFIQKMTNVGKDTLQDLYFGVNSDPDTPEQGWNEWTDDLCLFIEPDDPHIAEKLSDTTDAHLLENLAILYDPDDQSEGFKSSGIAWVGVKFLECTYYKNDGTTQPYGITAFHTVPWDEDTQSDVEAYNIQMLAGIEEPDNTAPHSSDVLYNKPFSYGPDVTWIMTAGGPEHVNTAGQTVPALDVAPGESVVFTFADFVGINEADLLRNAKVFQSLYNNSCSSPQPPDQPLVRAVQDDKKIVLYWDNRSEASIDPVTGSNSFQGYRVYRSTDRGSSWGNMITDLNGNPTDIYQPLAIYDKTDGVSGPFVMNDPLIYYNLGSESGLQYTFIDENIINGYEYWYAVTAYDGPDEWSGAPVDPMENSKAKDAYIANDNTVALRPQAAPAGFEKGGVDNVDHVGYSDATLTPITADPFMVELLGYSEVTEDDLISKGYTYLVEFHEQIDTVDSSNTNMSDWDTTYTRYWSMVNTTTGDTIIPEEMDIVSESQHVVDGFIPSFSGAVWEIEREDSTVLTPNDINSASNIPFVGLGHPSASAATWRSYMSTLPPSSVGELGGKPVLTDLWNDLELRFTSEGSMASYYNILTLYGMQEIDNIQVPFELWDVENQQRLNVAAYQTQGTSKPEGQVWELDSVIVLDSSFVYGDLTIDTSWAYGYRLNTDFQFIPGYTPYSAESILHYTEDTDQMGWVINWNKDNHYFNPSDRLRIYIPNPIIVGEDTYTITTSVDDYKISAGDLKQIKVVPNPYVVTSLYEQIAYVKEIHFTHLPTECVIRIYNTSGELVQLLEHNPNSPGYRGPSVEAWNLMTYNSQDVAFGVYVFHVVSGGFDSGEEFTGKFAVIK